jgi:hypothetical protein
MPDYAIELLRIVEAAAPQLRALGDDASARRPAPGKWSPREIVGHLIDSASNNHQRFVRAVAQDDLVFTGYAQDEWVATQQYQQAPWPDLVALWRQFNRHVARVMIAVPADIRNRRHRRHNLHELAWQPIPENEPATLDYFMRDYVRHLEHHVRQILGPRWSA